MQSEFVIQVSDTSPYRVLVGGQLALTVHAGKDGVNRVWEEEWKNWDELQNHAKMGPLVEKCDPL
eukprot:9476038-Pyramimonas_sp.AAC.1